MKLTKLAVALLLTSSLSGCGTLLSLGVGDCSPYSGVRANADLMSEPGPDGPALTALGIVDMPFSLVADTVLLPVTAVCAISD
ncbi:TPA: YceK/YidQ family lipoprotein [Mannheimia haemolytica]